MCSHLGLLKTDADNSVELHVGLCCDEELVALRFLAYGLFEVLCDIRTVRPIGTLTPKLRLNLYNYEDKIQFKINIHICKEG